MPKRMTGYLMGTFGLSTLLFLVIASWLKTDEPITTYFLSLIASHFINDKINKVYSEAKNPK